MLATAPATAADAPALVLEHLTTDDGLPQATVMTTLQDSQGFVWLGTEDGLVRFDGHELYRYARSRTERGSLPGNYVWQVVEDADVLIAATAILSGFVAELASGQTAVLKYQTAVLRELYLSDVVPAALKTLAFGLVVGLVGCYVGLTAGEGSEGVGRAATDSVVVCSLLVLAADVILVSLIKAVQAVT